MLKHGILGLLNYHQMTGYEIMRTFQDSLHFFWSAQTSQIYRELQTLEQKGWVGKTVMPQQGRPDKNIYTITQTGHEELLRWLADGGPELNTRNAVLMKVFFLGECGNEESIRYFENLKEYWEILSQGLDAAAEQVSAYRTELDDPKKSIYWEMTIEYGRRSMQMEIDWAQSCIDRLKEDK